jgi:hypothetical protein
MSESSELVWRAERFYWAVIDARGYRGSGPLPDALLPEFQAVCPQPVESYHAVCVPIQSGEAAGCLLVCAAAFADLESLRSHIERLVPDRVPAICADAVQLSPVLPALNMLVGAFEPKPVRARRWKRHLVTAACVLVCGGLVAFGLERRASRWDRVASESASAMRSVASKTPALSTSPPIGSDQLVEAHHMSAVLEAAALRFTRVMQTISTTAVPRDATAPLTQFLGAWPLQPNVKLLGVSVTADRISGSIAVTGDAAPLLAALRAPDGWSLAEPRISNSPAMGRGYGTSDGVPESTVPVTVSRISVTMNRSAGASPAREGAR